MFNPAIVKLLRLLAVHPQGVTVRELEGVDRALAKLVEVGVVELRGDLVVPLAPLLPLAQNMEKLVRRINRVEAERDQAMALVRLLFHGP